MQKNDLLDEKALACVIRPVRDAQYIDILRNKNVFAPDALAFITKIQENKQKKTQKPKGIEQDVADVRDITSESDDSIPCKKAHLYIPIDIEHTDTDASSIESDIFDFIEVINADADTSDE